MIRFWLRRGLAFCRGGVLRFIYQLSEWEAIQLRPGQTPYWRKVYLKRIKADVRPPFYIGRGFWIHSGQNFRMEHGGSLGEFARIMDHGPISIGKHFIAATGLQLNSGSHDPETRNPISGQIDIGDDVWCGANVTIIGKVRIGRRAIIGACSLVLDDIPDDAVAVGSPARVIRIIGNPDRQLWRWSEQ